MQASPVRQRISRFSCRAIQPPSARRAMTLRSRPRGVRRSRSQSRAYLRWRPGAGRRTSAARPVSCRHAPRPLGRPAGRDALRRRDRRRRSTCVVLPAPPQCRSGPNLIGGQQSVVGGMGQHFGPLDVVIAATNVRVLEGGNLFGAFQKGAIEAGLEDRTDGGRRLRKNGRARMVTPRWQAASTRSGP